MDMLIIRQVLLIGGDRFLHVLPAWLYVFLDRVMPFYDTESMPIT